MFYALRRPEINRLLIGVSTQPMNDSIRIPWTHHFARGLYTIILFILLPVLIFLMRKKLGVKAQPFPISQRKFSQRFGYLSEQICVTDILFHCASVGEVNASAAIIKRVLHDNPEYKITISTTSVTGATHAFNQFGDSVQHCFLPFDLPFAVKNFLSTLRPKYLCITEVEFWPNLVHVAFKRNIKLGLINGRISSKSLHTYKKFAWLYRYTLRKFSVICAQSEPSFSYFLSLGVYKSQLFLTRNTKFDLSSDPQDEIKATQLMADFSMNTSKLLLAASTHAPEEELLLDIFQRLRMRHEDLRLIIVPRHPFRFDQVTQLCMASGFRVARLTKGAEATQPDIIVVDAMGWLKACYRVSTLAFIGGSFATKGGHNALECALYGKPMLMGPSIFNNPEICQQLIAVNALDICETPSILESKCEYLLSNPDSAISKGSNGRRVLTQNLGAVEDTMSILRAHLLKN